MVEEFNNFTPVGYNENDDFKPIFDTIASLEPYQVRAWAEICGRTSIIYMVLGLLYLVVYEYSRINHLDLTDMGYASLCTNIGVMAGSTSSGMLTAEEVHELFSHGFLPFDVSGIYADPYGEFIRAAVFIELIDLASSIIYDAHFDDAGHPKTEYSKVGLAADAMNTCQHHYATLLEVAGRMNKQQNQKGNDPLGPGHLDFNL